MVTFTVDKDRKVSIGLFEAVMMPGSRTLRRSKKRISGNSVHAPSQEVLPAAPTPTPTPAPAANSPPPVTEPGLAVETAPGWTAEDDQKLIEIHRLGRLLAGKQGLRERYKQVNKSEAVKENDLSEEEKEKETEKGKEKEKAPTAETATAWTTEDDEQMVKLKKEKKSWKEIEAALGGKKGAKARYKEVHKDAATAGDDTDNEAEDKTKGTPLSNSLIITDADMEKTPSFEGQTIKPVMIYLCRLQEFFEAQKWVNVASKFFDKTGKRIDATELRAKLSSLWTESLPAR
ncbi:hypothetical protein MMC27_004440 [Xylographa pallens]|nr:hypothetical protein [Xylographa pallens]